MRAHVATLLAAARVTGRFRLVSPRLVESVEAEQLPALMLSRRRRADSEAEDDAGTLYDERWRHEVSIVVADDAAERSFGGEATSDEAVLAPYDEAEELETLYLAQLLNSPGLYEKKGVVVEPFTLAGRPVIVHTIIIEGQHTASY